MQTKDVNRERKAKDMLGVSRSTANTKLHREIIWMFLEKTNKIKCYRCGEEMTRDTFSIDHKVPWSSSDDPKKYFWDLENIGFSHSVCNSAASRGRLVPQKHGTLTEYQHYGCRCELCVEAVRKHQRENPRPSRLKKKQERLVKESTHGTIYMYRYKKCRCELCVETVREYWKKSRKSTKSSLMED